MSTAPNTLIDKLQKEFDSCWPYPNKERKKIKIDALRNLEDKIKTSASNSSYQTIVDDIIKRYPEAQAGKISHRTAELLEEIRNGSFHHNRKER